MHRRRRLEPSAPAGGVAWLLLALAACSGAQAETLLVVRKTGDAVDFMDPGSGLRLATVATGHAPHEISVSPDGQRAAITNYGTREQPGSTVSILDLAQPQEVRRIDLAPHSRPHGVQWYAPDRIAVTSEGSQRLLLVDPDAGRIVRAIETGQETSHMVVVSGDATRAYVTNRGSGTTSVLDLVAGRKLADVPTDAGSEALALTPDGRELWVAAHAAGHIAVVDTATLAVQARLPLPGMPIRIAFVDAGRTALVTCADSSELVAYDVAARARRAQHKVDGAPVGLLAAQDGRSVFVAATTGDRVLQFDARTLELLRTIEVSGQPDGLGRTDAQPKAICHGCIPLPGEH